MNESEVLFQISNIVNGRLSFHLAVQQIARLLEREVHGKAIIIEGPDQPDAATLLDSFDHSYRSLYSVDLRDGGKSLGKATLLFAANEFQGALLERLSDFVGEQLGMLLARTRLAEGRYEWRRELEKMEKDLATRKIMQRAEGILVSQRGLPAILARQWIAKQSGKTGLTRQEIAERIIVYYQKTSFFEQRIA